MLQQQFQQEHHDQQQRMMMSSSGTQDLTGRGDATLYDASTINDATVYTNGHQMTNDGGPQQQSYATTVAVNQYGKRVTTQTVRVPPPQQQQQQQQQHPQSMSYGQAPAHVVTVGTGTNSSGRVPSTSNGPVATTPTPDPVQVANDLTRNLVKKFIADIWNRGEIDLIPDVCSPNLRFNGNTGFDRIGHDGLARMVATIRESLDEYHCEIHSMVVEHNKAFCRLRFTGKHTGPLLGYAPTQKVVAWMGATEFTCQNGKILKVWELGDVKSLEEQLQEPASSSSKAPDEEEI